VNEAVVEEKKRVGRRESSCTW